jgi:hypothetical protein
MPHDGKSAKTQLTLRDTPSSEPFTIYLHLFSFKHVLLLNHFKDLSEDGFEACEE